VKRQASSALTRVRKICLGLPETEEKIAWGAPTWRVKGRLFAMFAEDHHGDGRIAIWCNAPEGAQRAMIDSDDEHFFRPPYVGPNGWLGIRLDTGLDWKTVAALVEQAHQVTAAKKKRRNR
jgi:predicted DNA-binding protein (MmcQ/YjbR family)